MEELMFIEFVENAKCGRKRAKYRCFCGKEFITQIAHVRSGHTKSCGCRSIRATKERATKHGGRKTSLYTVWCNMKARCNNPNSTYYEYYGGKGITVCEEWMNSFEAFKSWAETTGYKSSLTLDRIKGHLGYSPDNCRWATRAIQATNRKKFKNNSSGYRGVTKWGNKWRAQLFYENIKYDLGIFETKEEAALAYNKKSIDLFGEDSYINVLEPEVPDTTL